LLLTLDRVAMRMGIVWEKRRKIWEVTFFGHTKRKASRKTAGSTRKYSVEKRTLLT
jgi:hypothetical protein